ASCQSGRVAWLGHVAYFFGRLEEVMKWSWRPLIVSSGALAFALSALGPSRIHAQTVSTGAIAGTVTDPSGATIASVTITATEKATASKRVTQTDSSGGYHFSLLIPGEYELRFETTGVKTVVPPAVKVTVTETSTLNVQMILGEAKETVEVS